MEKKNQEKQLKKSDVTRKIIIDSAKVFFAEKGYEGTSFRTLAAAAELNHAVISYHFGNKEKLWLVVVQELFKEFIEDCGHLLTIELNEQTDNKKIFRDAVYSLVRFNAKKPHLIKIAFRESMSANPLIESTSMMMEQYISMSKDLLDKFHSVGIISKVTLEDFHFIFLSSITNRFMIPFLNKSMNIDDPYADEVIESHTDAIIKIFYTGPE